MIAYEKPGVPAPLHVRRVLFLALFIMVAMPIGWLIGLAGTIVADGFMVRLLAGMVMGLAMLAALAIVPTGVQRIAAGLEQGLDEFELARRLRAQSDAYRWFSIWVISMAILAVIAPSFGGNLSVDSFPIAALFFWSIAWSIALPAWFLARAMPRPVDTRD